MPMRRTFAGTILAAVLTIAGCTGSRPTLAPAPSSTSSAATASTIATTTTLVAPGSSLVAEAIPAAVGIYDAPDSTKKPRTSLSNPNPNGAPLVFLVKQHQGAWYQVYLPIRPNSSTGWVQANQVTVAPNPYRLIVSGAKHTLQLLKDNKVIKTFTVGIGRDQYPTPGGVFYIKELLRPPDPNGAYGPYAYGLSGFSNVKELANFEGGEGTIGIHGTNDPSSIGSSVSHGCVRMRNADITQLAKVLPLGTPVEIQQ
jgi:lipoprotein-anchoring transpeptidase ErfK/SrfK